MSRRRRAPARGGKRGYESRPRIRDRERHAVMLANQGRSQHEIAADLNISQAAVSKLLKRVDARALGELTLDLARSVAEHVRKLTHVSDEAMRAWERSKQDTTRKRQRKSDRTDHVGGSVAEITVETRHGDPRYLAIALKALADMRALLGLATPREGTGRTNPLPFSELSQEELEARIRANEQVLAAAQKETHEAPA